MILLEVVEAERRRATASKAARDTHEGPTLRHPELAHTPPPSSPKLPDYALSQAQAELEKQDLRAKAEKQRQKKIWRIITYVLAAYLVLSVGIGVPLFILVRQSSIFRPLDQNLSSFSFEINNSWTQSKRNRPM